MQEIKNLQPNVENIVFDSTQIATPIEVGEEVLSQMIKSGKTAHQILLELAEMP